MYSDNITNDGSCQEDFKNNFVKTVERVERPRSGNTNYYMEEENKDFENIQKDRSFLTQKQKAALIRGAFDFDCITDRVIKIKKLTRVFCTVTDHAQSEAKHSQNKKTFNKLLREKYQFEYVAKTEIRKTTGELHTHFEFFVKDINTKEKLIEFFNYTKKCWNAIMLRTIPDNEYWENDERSILDKKEHSKKTYNAAGLRLYFSKFPTAKEFVVCRPWTNSKGIKDLTKYVTINLYDKRKKVGEIIISARNSVKVKMLRTENRKTNNIINIKKTQSAINLHLYFDKFRKKLPYLINQKYKFGFTAMNRTHDFLKTYPEIKNLVAGMDFYKNEQANMEFIKDKNGVLKLIPRVQINTKRKIA